MTKIVNLCLHALTLRNLATGEDTVLPPSGTVARVSTTPGVCRPSDLPVSIYGPTTYGVVEGLPEPAEDTVYLVSLIVLARVSRLDVFAPGTAPNDGAIRDEKGQVKAVTRLIAAV